MAVPSQTIFPGYTGFQAPYIISDDGVIAGYFPEEESDLAVLSVTSFQPEPETSLTAGIQFQNVVRSFLASAQATNKTRLVIDLRDNGGGMYLENGLAMSKCVLILYLGQIALGYDLFTQLFPSIQPYGVSIHPPLPPSHY